MHSHPPGQQSGSSLSFLQLDSAEYLCDTGGGNPRDDRCRDRVDRPHPRRRHRHRIRPSAITAPTPLHARSVDLQRARGLHATFLDSHPRDGPCRSRKVGLSPALHSELSSALDAVRLNDPSSSRDGSTGDPGCRDSCLVKTGVHPGGLRGRSGSSGGGIKGPVRSGSTPTQPSVRCVERCPALHVKVFGSRRGADSECGRHGGAVR